MCVEFTAADTQHDVTERATIKQRAEVVTQTTVGNLDRRTAGLTGDVDRLSHHAHLTHHVTTTLVLVIIIKQTTQ